jgi:hypothetical protein
MRFVWGMSPVDALQLVVIGEGRQWRIGLGDERSELARCSPRHGSRETYHELRLIGGEDCLCGDKAIEDKENEKDR